MVAEQIHAYLRRAAGYERVHVGPFLATFVPGNDHPMRNYAIPDDSAAPSAADIEALVTCYRDRGLKPRLEYVDGAAPELEPVLLARGFTVEVRIPVLTLSPGQQLGEIQPEGIEVTLAATDRDHADAMVVAGQVYDGQVTVPSQQMVDWRRAMVKAGGGVAVARATDGTIVGSGLYPVPERGVTEIAAVGVLDPYRGHGVASALIAVLSQSAFNGGVRLLWLTAENEPERRAAEAVGFRATGDEMLHVSLPADAPR